MYTTEVKFIESAWLIALIEQYGDKARVSIHPDYMPDYEIFPQHEDRAIWEALENVKDLTPKFTLPLSICDIREGHNYIQEKAFDCEADFHLEKENNRYRIEVRYLKTSEGMTYCTTLDNAERLWAERELDTHYLDLTKTHHGKVYHYSDEVGVHNQISKWRIINPNRRRPRN